MLLGASVKHKPVPRTCQFVIPLHSVTQILEIQSENLNLAHLFLGLHVVVLILLPPGLSEHQPSSYQMAKASSVTFSLLTFLVSSFLSIL